MKKPFVLLLLILNVAVLAGQIFPQHAPPFAPTVNIVFLCLSLVYFLLALSGGKPK